MRMDASQDLSAWDVVNRYPERTLERIRREYGEEPRARRIARTIAARRESMPITTCLGLAGLVAEVCGKKGGRHPATRTYQAIKMEVNGEVQEIAGGLSSAVRMLRRGGRLSVISYHSIEDRIVKHFMRDGAKEKDRGTGAIEELELVIPEAMDFDLGHISVSSPLGRGLVDRGVGDVATIQLPSGVRELEILHPRTLHDQLTDAEAGPDA